MATTPDLGIPLVVSEQAQQEITHNEAILRLQAFTMGAIDFTNTPPGSPDDGDVYLIDDTPTGDWAGQANKIAIYFEGSWLFTPNVDDDGTDIPMGARHEGIQIYNRGSSQLMRWSGSAWAAV